jgi:plastocyanin
MTGVPTVKLGSKLRFTNLEGGWIYHTATSCAFPCLGPTGAAFPLADGRSSAGRPLDFDSSEMGVGVPAIGPTKQRLDYELDVTPERGFKQGDIVTYFCRIHPSMRGGFEVTAE